MYKKIDRRSADRINWLGVPHNRSKQKLGIKEAIKKSGNSRKLSLKSGVSAQLISNAVNYEYDKNGIYDKNTDITSMRTALMLEKVAKISGLAERICPSLKK